MVGRETLMDNLGEDAEAVVEEDDDDEDDESYGSELDGCADLAGEES